MSQYSTAAQFRAEGLRAAAVAGYLDSDLDVFLVKASAVIDAYIGSRYLQYGPLIQWGDELADACNSIAAYKLLAQRGLDPANASDAMLVDRYKDAIAFIRDVQNGRAQLNVQTTLPGSSTMPRVFSQKQRGW